MKKIIVVMALALAVFGMFAACDMDTAVRVTVRFEDPSCGNVIPDAVIEKGTYLGGKMIGLPPQRGLVFYGWYEGNTRYEPYTIIGSDVTLTARWSDDVVTVSFVFTQEDDRGNLIEPTAAIPDVTAIRGVPLSPLAFPVTPRSPGWAFVTWLLDGQVFTQESPVPRNITLEAFWVDKANPVYPPELELPDDFVKPVTGVYTVSFNTKGGGTIAPITVYANECIDEWVERFPPNPTVNSINPRAFFVAWFDNENREYDGRAVITRSVTLDAKWGLPPYIVDFDTDVTGVVSSTDPGYGSVDYEAQVMDSWDDVPKRVIVNRVTYEVPYNTNRWRILYRINLRLPSTFSTEFYTRYTIRARFYANKQGAKSWTDTTAFTPNKPADAAGYSKDGLLHGVNSPSDDGWGQVSWTEVANWNGQGADAETLLQRYNLDRKGGTINDSWVPLRGSAAAQARPPFLLIQTSDNYIGHIEVTQIVFHNGEKKYTMYEDEEGYATAEDGLEH